MKTNNINARPAGETSNNVSDEYDPYLYRKPARGLTYGESLLHFLKILSGVPLVASSDAVNHAGYVLAILAIPGMCAIFLLYLQLKFRIQYDLCKRHRVPYLSYSKVLEVSYEQGSKPLFYLTKISSISVNWLSILSQFGAASVTLMFFATSMEENFNLASRQWLLMFSPLLIIFVFVNDLKGLIPFSAVGLILQYCSLVIIFTYTVQDLPPISSRDKFKDHLCWTIFVARTLTALESVAVMNEIEKDMEEPKYFVTSTGVLNMATSIATILFCFFGVLGYLKYGPNYCLYFISTGSLTEKLPRDQVLAVTAKILYSSGLFLSYGLQCFPAHSLLWHNYIEKKLGRRPRKKAFMYTIRLFIVILTFLTSMLAPGGYLIISLIVRTFCLSFLGILFPGVLILSTGWPNNFRRLYFHVWLFILAFIVGSYFIYTIILWCFIVIKLVIEKGTIEGMEQLLNSGQIIFS